MNTRTYILLGAVCALILGGAVYIYMNGGNQGGFSFSPTASSTPTSASAPARSVPAGQKEYHSLQYHFSLLYPDNLTMREIPEQGGAMTITFEYDDKKDVSGFQIFIVPFSGNQITTQRFKEDVPSGIRTGLKNITVDSATGASFYSKDAVLGPTAEVWFTRDGYLYEATTFKELAPWLSQILQTWQFF